MPAQSEFGDAATVIDGPAGSTGYASTAAYKHTQAHVVSGRAKGAESASMPGTALTTFARMPDYFSEEGAFVEIIGKKGVLGALQELDAHLRTVRVFPGPYARILAEADGRCVAGWIQQDSFR